MVKSKNEHKSGAYLILKYIVSFMSSFTWPSLHIFSLAFFLASTVQCLFFSLLPFDAWFDVFVLAQFHRVYFFNCMTNCE